MNNTDIAHYLDHAQTSAQEVAPLTPDPTIDDAYAIQRLILNKHVERGEHYVGPKLGFTSHAKMEQMGVSNIIVGFLTDAMQVNPHDGLSLNGLIHPRIEPELVFHLSKEVPATGTAQELAQELYDATDKVTVGMEVIDSRYKDFQFTYASVIADNTSAAKFIVGKWQDYPRDLEGYPVTFSIDNEPVETATTDAILGNPTNAFRELAEMMLKYDIKVPAGSIILAGAMTPAQWLKPGQTITAEVESFEPLSIEITE